MIDIESLQEENIRINNQLDVALKAGEQLARERDEAKKNCEILAAEIESLRQERNAAQADLAQMKSTLSDTQQKLRAVQEDRDEFAAKMNDAVERADQLQARCGDLESILKERDSEKISLLQQICQLKVECGDMEKERDEAAEKIKDFENLKRRIEGMMEAFQLIVKGSSIE